MHDPLTSLPLRQVATMVSLTITADYWLVFVDVILFWFVGQFLGQRVNSARGKYKVHCPCICLECRAHGIGHR